MNEASTISPASTRSRADLGDAPDVLHPVRVGEPEVPVEPVAEVVPVEEVGVAAERVERRSTRLAMVDLPAPGQAGEPHHRRSLA